MVTGVDMNWKEFAAGAAIAGVTAGVIGQGVYTGKTRQIKEAAERRAYFQDAGLHVVQCPDTMVTCVYRQTGDGPQLIGKYGRSLIDGVMEFQPEENDTELEEFAGKGRMRVRKKSSDVDCTADTIEDLSIAASYAPLLLLW